jgi:ParB-like chromosome segregation protein Spo0J
VKGVKTRLVVDSGYTVTNGHHRIVAAQLVGLETINVVVCPQKSTYGR